MSYLSFLGLDDRTEPIPGWELYGEVPLSELEVDRSWFRFQHVSTEWFYRQVDNAALRTIQAAADKTTWPWHAKVVTGSLSVEFHAHLRPGDVLKCYGKVLHVKPKPDTKVATVGIDCWVDRQGKLLHVAEALVSMVSVGAAHNLPPVEHAGLSIKQIDPAKLGRQMSGVWRQAISDRVFGSWLNNSGALYGAIIGQKNHDAALIIAAAYLRSRGAKIATVPRRKPWALFALFARLLRFFGLNVPEIPTVPTLTLAASHSEVIYDKPGRLDDQIVVTGRVIAVGDSSVLVETRMDAIRWLSPDDEAKVPEEERAKPVSRASTLVVAVDHRWRPTAHGALE